MRNLFSELLKAVRKEEIARRYALLNSFDGAITIFGIILALYVSGVKDIRIVVVSCIGAAVSMGVSGFWGAYATELAERTKTMKVLERHLLRKLSKTEIGRRVRAMAVVVALVDGLSPLLVSFAIITPLLLCSAGWVAVDAAFKASMALVFLVLLALGAFTGRIAGEGMLPNALKMLSAGVVVAVLALLLEKLSLF